MGNVFEILKICMLMVLISFSGVQAMNNTNEAPVRKVRFDLTQAEIKAHSGSMRLLSHQYLLRHPSVITTQVRDWFKKTRGTLCPMSGMSFFDKIANNLQKINELSYKTNLCYLRGTGWAMVFINANDPNSFYRFQAYINNVINPWSGMEEMAEEDGRIMQELTGMQNRESAATMFQAKILFGTARVYKMQFEKRSRQGKRSLPLGTMKIGEDHRRFPHDIG